MKRDKVFTVIWLVLLVAALGAIYWWYFYTPLGRIVIDVGFEGIVLDPEKCPAGMLLTKSWKVESSDIRKMEPKLEVYISRNRIVRGSRIRGNKIISELSFDRRQYLGMLDAYDGKVIKTFFCNKNIVNRRDWLLHHFDIAGGWDCDWTIIYDVSAGTFYDLIVNVEEWKRED